MLVQEPAQPRDDLSDGDAGRQPDPQHSAHLASAARRLIRFLEGIEDRLDASEILAARLRENNRTGRPRQERCSDVALERSDDPGRRRLRDAELASGAREAPGPGDAHEEPESRHAVIHVEDK